MPRKPRAAPPTISPLEVIAQQLCAMPRVPHVYTSESGRVSLEGIEDSEAFVEAIKALRLERCDKAKLDEALQLKKTLEETRDLLDGLRSELPGELL